MGKTAVVLFNLGGPDSLEAVRPFLFNLFNDKAIITAPQPIRWLLAKYISTKRAPIAQGIYKHLGGKSPLLELTKEQASALEKKLGNDFRVFICMRYWHPMSGETAKAVKDYNPDDVVLLPLYPQYSTTTTGSSVKDWFEASKKIGLTAPTQTLCCYPKNFGFIEATADLIEKELAREKSAGVRILFSAHGLPKKVIAAGDPYQAQVEQTAAAVMEKLIEKSGHLKNDWAVCYQSRVGPLEWIGPSLEEEVERAARDGVGVCIIPIAFVSEHSETLVELDIEYREQADKLGVRPYLRVPAVATHDAFIEGLSGLVNRVRERGLNCCSDRQDDQKNCAGTHSRCPNRVGG